jgi:hypothetical protein
MGEKKLLFGKGERAAKLSTFVLSVLTTLKAIVAIISSYRPHLKPFRVSLFSKQKQ